ncbi:phosphoserine phosphatase SerB [Bacteriovorax sp. Seq25_V]|uniref:phosphoserine phosphatase SerB n=1 Tax=Bacteriovorax sp. Seq25_V TaxID=1201288 RepID=UPI00038A190B|nr:phosphoserine phosphatase SerB [Bacteriovorax sp. Seq25_V]EQC44358.1 phosphoserine phosphatase SerB [Bacteriovorax sp. Seq25_V]
MTITSKDNFEGKNLLIKISGPDHPGITARLMKIVSENNTPVLDIGQSVTHGLLSLSFVLKIDENCASSDHVIKELLFESYKMGMTLDYKVVESLLDTVAKDEEKFILNCVAPVNITPHFIRDISSTLAKFNVNILRIDKVSPTEFTSLEILTIVPVSTDHKKLKEELIGVSNTHKIDIAFLKDNVFRRSKRLIVFDMDSTLIQAEVIDELAKAHGVGDEISEITEQAMNGELDFNQSLTKRVSMLKGLDAKVMHDILEKLPLTPGVEEFVQTIKKLGYKVAIISGGFTYFANALKEKLKLDYAFANELEIIDGKLTGNVLGTIVNADQKAILVSLIAQQENISLEQVVAIGDGANDLPMLSQAGLGIAFHAKDIVKKAAQNHMSHGPMTSILYFLGIPGSLK